MDVRKYVSNVFLCAYIIVPAITIAGVIVQGTNEAMEYIDKFNQNKSMQIENTPEIYLKKRNYS